MGEWVDCKERLPTKEDADAREQVITRKTRNNQFVLMLEPWYCVVWNDEEWYGGLNSPVRDKKKEVLA